MGPNSIIRRREGRLDKLEDDDPVLFAFPLNIFQEHPSIFSRMSLHTPTYNIYEMNQTDI